MAISEYNYIPTYIKRTIANKPKDVVTASYWNELFNLLITQGDYTAKELGNILNHFTTVITGAASDTADAIAEEHEYASAFEIHLSTNANPITADKTFVEIRQAIVDKREILLWVSEVQCLKPTCKAFEHTITLTVFDYSFDGPVVRADVYECYDENEWFISQNIELANQNDVGDIRNLTTTHKSDLVAAINEVKQTADTKTNAADLASVATSGSYNDLTDKPTIPSVPTATINANAAARHEHGNKTVLDLISETVKAAWDATSTWVTTNGANVLSHLSDSIKHITAAERTLWNGKQDKLIAGDNIMIAADGKTISATGGGGGVSGDNIETVEAQQIDIPVKLSDFENDSGFVTNSTVEAAIADKQDTISDLENIRSGAGKGATALQAVPSTYRTASAQDVIDNGLSDRVSTIEGKEAGWNGKYSKPTNGIPKTDLANDVQVSLGKADTALQSHQSLAAYRTASAQDTIDKGKVDKVAGKRLSTNDYTNAAKAKVDAIPANPKYTDTVYNDTAVRNRLTAIENKENVTLTPTSSRIKNVSYTAKYIQLLGAVLVRIYCTINTDMNAGYDYDIMTIDGYLPNSTAALAVKCSKNAMAIAKKADGGAAIQIRPLESGINGYDVWITGFWFV